MKTSRVKPGTYIAVRRRHFLGYVEFLGPFVSDPADKQADAERLYGKTGHSIAVLSWSQAPAYARAQCHEEDTDANQERRRSARSAHTVELSYEDP